MPELNRWNERIQMPDGHPLPFKAMLDAARICFPTCNEASQALGTGAAFDSAVAKALRSVAYAIEQSADFQIAEYYEDGTLYHRVLAIEAQCDALARQVATLLERDRARGAVAPAPSPSDD